MSHVISIKPVIQNRDESYPIQGTLERDSHALGDLEYTVRESASYSGMLEHIGEGVRFSGIIEMPVSAACVRCLEPFDTVIRGRFDQTYFFEPTATEEGDPEPTVGDGYDIDVEPPLNEALVAATPFAPVHDRSCQGLCGRCGCNLNEELCSCDDEIDPTHPFASLKDLV